MIDEVAELEPQTDADASPADRFADDKSVDTSIDTAKEPVEVDAETDEIVEEVESEADSSPADEENVEETIDADEKFSENVKGRIDELTSKWRDSERNIASKNQEIEELRKQIADKPVEVESLKTLEDFEYDQAKFDQYKVDESDRRTEAAIDKRLGTITADSAKQKAYDDFFVAEKAFAETVKDYHQVIGDPSLKISPDMAYATQVTMNDPGLVYYLASNKDVAERLFNMSKESMLVELGSIRANQAAEKAKAKPKIVSDALPPVSKIKGGDPGRVKKITDSDISDSQFKKMREKQIANR
jgi:hypothetical protein